MRSLKALAEHLESVFNGEYGFTSATIDSREAGPGKLFFALKGSKTDGHNFVDDVLAKGGAAVVEKGDYSGPVIKVPSAERALLEAGAWVRDSLRCPVIGITGSSGKTTTRIMLASALSTKYRTHQTPGNLNNHLGLPLTLLSTPENAEAVVLEMGMNHTGELLELGRAARPWMTLVTNTGSAHIEYFGTVEKIAEAKAELLRCTETDGVAIIPVGNQILFRAAEERGLEILTHGRGGDFSIENGKVMPWGTELTIAFRGEHNMQNALVALAAAWKAGINPAAAVEALKRLRPGRGRGAEYVTGGGVRLVDESYNANPESTLACLKYVSEQYGKPVMAVLGDMLELGANSAESHRDIIEKALGYGFEYLVLTGPLYAEASEGFDADNIISVNDWRQALSALKSVALPGSTVLVKGSNSMKLGMLVDKLMEEGL